MTTENLRFARRTQQTILFSLVAGIVGTWNHFHPEPKTVASASPVRSTACTTPNNIPTPTCR